MEGADSSVWKCDGAPNWRRLAGFPIYATGMFLLVLKALSKSSTRTTEARKRYTGHFHPYNYQK